MFVARATLDTTLTIDAQYRSIVVLSVSYGFGIDFTGNSQYRSGIVSSLKKYASQRILMVYKIRPVKTCTTCV